jgi:nucleotide-binding universal stress UspA family protein
MEKSMTASFARIKALLAIDTSETAHYAVQLLAHIHPLWHVTILHVIDVEAHPHPHLSGGLLQDYHRQLTHQLRAEAGHLVSKIHTQLGTQVSNVDIIVRNGAAAELILAEAQARQVDVVILGSRGLSSIPALLLGSVSYQVTHRARCSVLVVKRPVMDVDTMLVAMDQSPGARAAAACIQDSGLLTLVKRTLVATVTHALPGQRDVTTEAAQNAPYSTARAFVRKLQQQFAVQGQPPEGLVLVGEPAAALLDLAQRESADLIVVGTRGRTGMRRFLLGSVSQKILMHATCAVLSVRTPPWKKKTG